MHFFLLNHSANSVKKNSVLKKEEKIEGKEQKKGTVC